MASKRYSQSAGPVILKKLPRLAPAPSFLPSKIPGTSSPVPHPGSGNHFNYKGSYFACPLQSPEGPEQPPAGWSPTPAYLHYSPGALSQPVPAEGPVLGVLLYPPESLGTRLQPPDTQKSKDTLSQEQLMARKKLDSPRCPLPVKKPVMVKRAAPLAVPKPVYGTPASLLAPRMALILGAQAESLQQRPGEEPLYPGRRNSSPAPQDTPHGGPGQGDACKVMDPAKELSCSSPSMTPIKGLEDLRDTKALSSSPPMPVIHNVFSLAPYQEYLEKAKGSDAVQSQGESCYRKLESQEGSPDRVGTKGSPPKDMVLDLSFKKRRVEAGDTQRPPGCAEGTLDREDKEEKEAAGGKVGLGEEVQPQVPETDSGDRSSFQSSANFMFQKYKLLPPAQPPSSTPTPAPPASSPSSNPPLPPPSPQLSIILAPNPAQTVLPKAPSTPEEEKVLVVKKVGIPSGTPSGQYFSSLHTLLCDTISGSVSRSSPELLRQWLKKKPSNGKEIWLAFQDVAALLTKLLSQLRSFMSACPFPHVVRAGAIFIPIHVVKEKLFPKLPGSFVDQGPSGTLLRVETSSGVLQEHTGMLLAGYPGPRAWARAPHGSWSCFSLNGSSVSASPSLHP
uniref:Uncharacterized protein n=1 Tax=Geospiza parvula TaxID=87175 RepID=A0A8C3MD38_GEOPR